MSVLCATFRGFNCLIFFVYIFNTNFREVKLKVAVQILMVSTLVCFFI